MTLWPDLEWPLFEIFTACENFISACERFHFSMWKKYKQVLKPEVECPSNPPPARQGLTLGCSNVRHIAKHSFRLNAFGNPKNMFCAWASPDAHYLWLCYYLQFKYKLIYVSGNTWSGTHARGGLRGSWLVPFQLTSRRGVGRQLFEIRKGTL